MATPGTTAKASVVLVVLVILFIILVVGSAYVRAIQGGV